jgi:hypothetical protein
MVRHHYAKCLLIAPTILHYHSSNTYTTIELTPKQFYSECANKTATDCENPTDLYCLENPLRGRSKEISIRVDDQDPEVMCGFYDMHGDNPFVTVDGKILYHRMRKGDKHTLGISNFMYKVTVSRRKISMLAL